MYSGPRHSSAARTTIPAGFHGRRPETNAAAPCPRSPPPALAECSRPGSLGPCCPVSPESRNASTSIVSLELELDAARQRAVDDKICSGDEAGRRTGQEHNGARDLSRRAHPAGRIEGKRLSEQS